MRSCVFTSYVEGGVLIEPLHFLEEHLHIVDVF